MPCYRIHEAYVSADRVSFGKDIPDSTLMRLPCGRCFGCRMDRVRSWSTRCQLEASCWDSNAFVTLTYDEEHVPRDGGLRPRDLQLWFKRLRRSVGAFRYFAVGEYGGRTSRPHYHALLFGVELPRGSQVGKRTFESPAISRSWEFGSHQVGSVTPASASYVAGYAMKKVFGSERRQEEFYGAVDLETGEFMVREREFARMSLRPGIGRIWFDKYFPELILGYVVRDGQKVPVPRYFRKLLKEIDPARCEELDNARARFFARAEEFTRTEQGLIASEAVAKSRYNLSRSESDHA